MKLLVTIDGAIVAGITTFRWSTEEGHIDALGRVYEPRVIQAGNYSRSLVREGGTWGRSQAGYGLIEINNADGALDGLLSYAFNGRDVTISRTDGTVILRGTVGGFEFRRRSIAFRLRDRQAVVADRLIVPDTYAGTNSGGVGLEGTANDIKGAGRPRVFGKLRAIRPAFVNTSINAFQLSAGPVASVDQVQDGGSVITAGSVYTTLADLQVTAPSGGTVRAFLGNAADGSFIRTGSDPVRILTADVTEGATSADRTPAGIMRRILLSAGLPAGDVEGVADVDSVAGWTAGYYVPPGGNVTARAALDAMAQSVHGYWVGTRSGAIRLGVLRAPEGIPRLVVEDWAILEDGSAIERIVTEGEGLPFWRVTVRYQRVWTPQTRDQLAGIAKTTQEYLTQEWRATAPREDASILSLNPLARELTVDAHLDAEADAIALRDALWTLYSVQRDTFTVAVPSEIAIGVDLADVVQLKTTRFGMSSGRLFRVVGIDEDLARSRAILTLWG